MAKPCGLLVLVPKPHPPSPATHPWNDKKCLGLAGPTRVGPFLRNISPIMARNTAKKRTRMWADRKLLRFKEPPEAVPYKETKAEKIERCRLKVLSYRVMAQSKATLTRFPTKSAGVLNWMHRRKNILEYAPNVVPCTSCALRLSY